MPEDPIIPPSPAHPPAPPEVSPPEPINDPQPQPDVVLPGGVPGADIAPPVPGPEIPVAPGPGAPGWRQ